VISQQRLQTGIDSPNLQALHEFLSRHKLGEDQLPDSTMTPICCDALDRFLGGLMPSKSILFPPSSLLSFLVKCSQWDAELTESDVKSAANVPSVNQDSPEFRFLHLYQSE
jgi:hypothetical protein